MTGSWNDRAEEAKAERRSAVGATVRVVALVVGLFVAGVLLGFALGRLIDWLIL